MHSRIRSRFYWIKGQEQAGPSAPGEALFGSRPYQTGWIIVGTLTAVYLLWLWIRLTLQPAWLDALPDLVNELLNLIELGLGLTLAILWIVLVWRYRHRANATRSDVPDLEELISMDPGAFERYVAGLFQQKGYGVVHRGRSGDHGVDLELTSPTDKQAIVQCKRYQGTVGEDVVRDLFGTLMHERVARAFLVTTGEISGAAKLWANGKPLTLIDGNTLLGIASSLADSDTG
jgi:hypothetical protein